MSHPLALILSARSSSLLLGVGLCLGAFGCSTPTETGPAKTQAGAVSCDEVAFAAAPETVVAQLDGAPVKMADLGGDVAKAERRARRTYCNAVYEARSNALESYLTDKLVKKRAAEAGKDEDTWLREEVQKRATLPTDAEQLAFYAARKSPEAPPFELVKDRVVATMMQERQQDAVRTLLDEIQRGAPITRALPEIRPAAVDMKPSAHTAVKGKVGAKVQVTEFADFQCPYCSRAAETMHALVAKYGDRVEFTFRHYPLRSIHPSAERAAEYAQCAAQQGRFWEMHDSLFAKQEDLGEDALKASAASVSLDQEKLNACLAGSAAAEVENDVQLGDDAGVEGTPSFFINGRQHTGAPTEAAIGAAIEALL